MEGVWTDTSECYRSVRRVHHDFLRRFRNRGSIETSCSFLSCHGQYGTDDHEEKKCLITECVQVSDCIDLQRRMYAAPRGEGCERCVSIG